MEPNTTDRALSQTASGDRRRQIAAGRDADDLFRLVVEATPNAMVLANAQGRILLANAGAEKLVGYTREELIGQSVDLLLPETTRVAPSDAPQSQATSRARAGDHFAQRKDGSLVPVEIGLNAIETTEGPLTLSTIIDLTDRNEADEELRTIRADLEQRALQLTAQLDAANRELEAFSYSVSHDLRAPLRVIDGFSQAALEDYGPQLPEDGRRYLQTIREGAHRMGVLIDDLLTLARLSRTPLKQQQVDFGQLLRALVADPALQPAALRVDLRIGEMRACVADPALLRQVWMNLLSNAFKYSARRPAPVVEIGSQPMAEGHVYFIRDNGTGFDPRYAGKLFGIFQRLHRAEDFPGRGVGLAIAQRIIHRHGGRIWAEAAVDCGATFYFTLQGPTTP